MRNPLQDRLLKAGLVKKGQLDQVVRQQTKQREGKAAVVDQAQVDAAALLAQRAERDRQLAAERNEQARQHELRAQVRQIIESHKVPRTGDSPYRFSDGPVIKSLFVDASQRKKLAAGTLVIVRHEQGHELLPRDAADKVRSRDPEAIVVDHANTAPAAAGADSDPYAKFVVPDDLVW